MRDPYINIKNWLGRILKILANELKKPKKFIYLTFDDGPLPGTCETIDLCKNLNSKATYFMVGCHNKSEQTNLTIQSLISNKNQFIVGNHSFSHANEKYKEYYQNPMGVLADFEKARLSLGLETKIARLPGLNAWANSTFFFGAKAIRSVSNVLITSGYSILGWDIEWKPIKKSLKFSNKHIIF